MLAMVVVPCAGAQECTSYVVVNVYEPKLKLDVQTAQAKDFAASADRKALEVTSATQDYTSRLLVLVETDGMAENSRAADAVQTVTLMARQAPEGQPVAYGVYADRAVFTKGFFSDSKERTAAINAVREEAGSLGKRVAMYDALIEGLKLFGEPKPGDAVLLVGFPYDDKSHNRASVVAREFMARGVRLLVMLREPLSNTTRDFMLNNHDQEKDMFSNLTVKTGGAYTDFDPHFFGWVWRGYLLGIRQTGGAPSSRSLKWKLKLQGTMAATLRRAKVFYPDLLPPCSIAPK